MSKRVWVYLGILSVSVAVLGLGLGVAYIEYKENQRQSWRDDGLAAYDRGDWSTARRFLRGYLATYRDDVPVLWKYAEATSNILEGRTLALRDASKAYFQIAGLEPDTEEALDLLIECDMTTRAWYELEYHMDYFLDERPDDEKLRYYHALALDRTDQLERAAGEYSSLIEDRVARVEVYGHLARVLFERGFEDRALRVFDNAFRENSDKAGVAVQQALYYLDRGDTEAAGLSLRRATSLVATNDPNAQAAALRLAVEEQQWDEAERIALRRIEAGGNLRSSYSGLAMAYQGTSRHVKAIDFLRSLDPLFLADNPEFQVLLAELLIAKDRIDEASEVLEELKRIQPGHIVYHNYLEARILLAEGNAARAASKLTMVLDASPSFRHAHLYLASASLLIGDRDGARSRLESYLYNYPKDQDALSLYAREFGAPQSLEVLLEEAEDLLLSQNVPSSRLTQASSVLYRRSFSLQQEDENKETILALLEKAIAAEPGYGVARLLLGEFLSNYGDLAEAARALTGAAEQGVPGNALRIVQAAVAIESDDLEKALNLYHEQLSSEVTTVNEIIRWATFFIRRVDLDTGMEILDTAIEQAPEEDRMTLRVEQVELLTRYGEIDGALSRLDDMMGSEVPSPEEEVAILQKREGVIRALIRLGPQNDPQRAKELASKLAERYRTRSSAQLLYAKVLLNQQPPDIEAARAITEPLIESNPDNLGALMAAADIAARQGNMKLAQGYAEQAAWSRDSDADTHVFLARLYLFQQRDQDAINSLGIALSRESEHVGALSLLVDAYRAAGQMSRAEATIDRLSSIVADDERALEEVELMRGRLQLGQKENLESVEALFRGHYSEKPDNMRVVVDLATVLAYQGKVAEGEDLLKRYVEGNASQAQAWFELGRFYINSTPERDIPKAMTALTQALVADRNYLPALRLQLEIAAESDQSLQALGFCDRYLALDPNNLSVLARKARLHAFRGAYSGALEAINRAIKVDPNHGNMLFRGNVYVAMGEYAKALEDFDSLIYRDDSEDVELLFSMVEAYLGLEDVEQAEVYFTQAMRNIDEPTARSQQVENRLKELGSAP